MPTLRTILLASILSLPVCACLQAADASPSASPVEEGYGMLRGPGFAFVLKAPAGWVIDPSAGMSQGLPAVFYPRGGSWEGSPAVAYARSRPWTREASSVGEVVASVVAANPARGNSGYQAQQVKKITTPSGKEGIVYRFGGSKSGEIEATVYFPEKRTVDFITLSAPSDKVLEASLPALEELAASYEFQPDKIPVDPKKQGFFQDGPPKD